MQCLIKDKVLRPSASELINHAIFKKDMVNGQRRVFDLLDLSMKKCQNLIEMA